MQSSNLLRETAGSAVLTAEEAFRLAVENHKAGKLKDAECLYRAILESQPGHTDACHSLGVLLAGSDNLKAALPLFKSALETNPNIGRYWISYIETLAYTGKTEAARQALIKGRKYGLHGEAADRLEEIIAQFESNNSMLVRLFYGGDYAGTERLAASIVETFPQYAFAWKTLGAVLRQTGRFADAFVPMQKSVRLIPDDAEAHNNLGILLKDFHRPVDAENSFRRAIEIKPDYAEAHNNLGAVLCEAGRLAEAEDSCRRAVSLKPDYAEGYTNLGAVMHNAGRLAEAEDCYSRAVSIKPELVESHRNLSLLKKFTLGDPRIAVLRSLYETIRNESDKTQICFALAKACEDTGESDEAFAFYAEGNRLRKKEIGYTIEHDRGLFADTKSVFEKPSDIYPLPLRSKKPIMIVGMPRSGTSLVEQILASHGDVYGAGELFALIVLVRKYFTPAPLLDLAAVSRQITSAYLDELEGIGGGRRFITDKMPDNFRWLGFLMSAQPDIKVVHTVRNPMAVCWSNFRQYFSAKGPQFAYDLADIAEYYRLYEDLMLFWKERFPGRIYDLNYERLTENQEEETRKLLDYCGLDWDERCLEFEKTERAVMTASAVQVRNKIYKGSSEAWRRFEKHLGPLISALKYNENKAGGNIDLSNVHISGHTVSNL